MIFQEIVVKGFIMTLTSRLEQVEGKWKLTVIINDGTASCEVDIEDQVSIERNYLISSSSVVIQSLLISSSSAAIQSL